MLRRLQGAGAHGHGDRANSPCDSRERWLFRRRQSPTGARTRLSAEEDTPGGKHVVILSDRFWRSEFGGHADVIGRTVTLNAEAYTIVGVMPATASFASWTGMASDVDPARTHRRAARRPRESQSVGRRASEARCRTGAGASRDGRHLRTART